MNDNYGYIYIRTHSAYDVHNAVKLGKTMNIPDRDSQYATGEVVRGQFNFVVEMPRDVLHRTELLLQRNLHAYHIQNTGGTEFYNNCILENNAQMVRDALTAHGVSYRMLDDAEVATLLRKYRVHNTIRKLNALRNEFVNALKRHYRHRLVMRQVVERARVNVQVVRLKRVRRIRSVFKTNNRLSTFTPRPDQEEIITQMVSHFRECAKGVLVIPCGVGKTMMSLWCVRRMWETSNNLNGCTLLIGAPNKQLTCQWSEIVRSFFTNVRILQVEGSVSVNEIGAFLNQTSFPGVHVVITTYSSAHKVLSACEMTTFTFDMKINDECHHLTSKNMRLEDTTKTYVKMLQIPSNKQLSLTATLKLLDYVGIESEFNNVQFEDVIESPQNGAVVSNDNIEYFGEIITQKSLLWAIQNNTVCDYVIQTVVVEDVKLEEQISAFMNVCEMETVHENLFLAAYSALKSMAQGHSHHLLVYTNTTQNAIRVVECITMLLKHNYFPIFQTTDALYCANYAGDMNAITKDDVLEKFRNAKWGIISCVYCLGEGWDVPLLDGVVFAENMTSDIRIVQSALRANRKNAKEPNKRAKIILPVVDRDDWLEDTRNSDLQKVKRVVQLMGTEDECINQKVMVYRMPIESTQIDVPEQGQMQTHASNSTNQYDDALGMYDETLTDKIRLKTVRRLALGITYKKAQQIIVAKCIRTKEQYIQECANDARLAFDPQIVYREKFKSWFEYLGHTRDMYYDLNTCRQKIKEFQKENPEMLLRKLDIATCLNRLSSKDPMFPPEGMWPDCYGIAIEDIMPIRHATKKKTLHELFH